MGHEAGILKRKRGRRIKITGKLEKRKEVDPVGQKVLQSQKV